MIRIDGSMGEGGGQILRTSLALSCLTGQPVSLARIRAGRRRPGLLRQHLCCVRAAAAISAAEVEGASLGSRELVFRPGPVRGGAFEWSVGSAGSAGLVLQAVLPPLLVADRPSTLVIRGGTHNPASPPAEFLGETFLPAIRALGPTVDLRLVRHGFYPAGGGSYEVVVEPVPTLAPVERSHREPTVVYEVEAKVAHLARHIAFREVQAASAVLGLDATRQRAHRVDSDGPGNTVVVRARAGDHTEVFTGFGRKGVPAETIGRAVAEAAARWHAGGAPVGEHLADQLLVPMAMAGGGSFHTGPLSRHTTTNIEVVQRFLDARFTTSEAPDGTVRVSCSPSNQTQTSDGYFN